MSQYYTIGELSSNSLLFKPVSDEEFHQLKYGRKLETNVPLSCTNTNQKDTSLLFKPVSDEEFYQLKYGRPIESSLLYQQEEKSNRN
jgi:hypothetical protein